MAQSMTGTNTGASPGRVAARRKSMPSPSWCFFQYWQSAPSTWGPVLHCEKEHNLYRHCRRNGRGRPDLLQAGFRPY